MKKLIFIVFILVIGLSSCDEPPVVFVGPQPEGSTSRSSIDMIYRGTFLCESDSALVYVKRNLIYKEKAFTFQMSLEEIEETEGLQWTGNQLIATDWPTPIPAEMKDSFVHSTILLQDTLFQVGPNQVLKSFRGHQVINKRISNNKWEVQILSLDADFNLRLSKAGIPTDLEQLKEITTVKDISTEEKYQLLIAPTQMEFEEILYQKLIFEECDLFTRSTAVFQI